MSNAELIERLNKPCGRTTGHGESCSVGWLCGACADKAKAADALELADKRIAELAKFHAELHVEHGKAKIRIGELERKLAVAREACKDIRRAIERECYAAAYIIVSEALAQIGGEYAR